MTYRVPRRGLADPLLCRAAHQLSGAGTVGHALLAVLTEGLYNVINDIRRFNKRSAGSVRMQNEAIIISGLSHEDGDQLFDRQVGSPDELAQLILDEKPAAFVALKRRPGLIGRHARKRFVMHLMSAAGDKHATSVRTFSTTEKNLFHTIQISAALDSPTMFVTNIGLIGKEAARIAGVVVEVLSGQLPERFAGGGPSIEINTGIRNAIHAQLPGTAQAPVAPLTAGDLAAGRVRRERLLATEDWLTAEQVYDLIAPMKSKNAKNKSQLAARLRKEGKLMAVRDGARFMHPAVQFNAETGGIRPVVRELLSILPKSADGWGNVFWLYQPHALLNGERPADMLATAPERVLAAARQTYESLDAIW